ncbi:hypothetical protein HMPREF0208_01027 [Citrobacter koseri]|nr:hypothetical protein HMPREF3220_02310 [Citrobacter koseri]KXB45826.1 hypothetical protein HMPREF0208_01027 [Citrobacter koseri]
MAASPYPAYSNTYCIVGPVSVAPPGIMPDDGIAFSTYCRPGKRRATGRNAG